MAAPSPASSRAPHAPRWQWAMLTVCTLAQFGAVSAQAAAQIGGAPPKAVQQQLCTIADVFSKLQDVTTNVDCRSGCGEGECPPGWMPTALDECNAQCGRVFEPFWDQCGEMLVQAHMGGMEEMGTFYYDCLEELYPPGSCGTFCNEHTYDCYLTEVHQACCDEEGTNCNADSDVPVVCPVGCAIVFPEFLETCREHVAEHEASDPSISVAEFEAFEQQCLTTDGLALVEYALDLAERGCVLDLSGLPGGGHRRLQQFLMQRLSSGAEHCAWDEIDDLAQDVSSICCANGVCPEGSLVPTSCSPGCAVALHQFTASCGSTLLTIDPDYQQIMAFEQSCLDGADPLFFLDAIKNAQCDGLDQAAPLQPPPPPPPPPPPLCNAADMVLDYPGGHPHIPTGHAVFEGYDSEHSAELSAQVVVADPLTGCVGDEDRGQASPTGLANAAAMHGKIALIKRGPPPSGGVCMWTSKVINAQNAGAIGAIVYDNHFTGLTIMSGADVGITITSVFVGITEGDALNAAVTADPSLVVDIHC